MYNLLSKWFFKKSESFENQNHVLDDTIRDLLSNNWAIEDDDILVLENEIEMYRQHGKISVLEIGSGASTLVIFRKACSMVNEFVIHSIEQSKEWQNRMLSLISSIEEKEKASNISIFHAEYCLNNGFCLEELNLSDQYDIIFIDAPPDTSVPDGRLKIVRSLINKLNPKGSIIIHDVSRNMENYAFHIIKEKFIYSEIIPTKKGVGILRYPVEINFNV
jgi:predicted O-methyltransferase YrrM